MSTTEKTAARRLHAQVAIVDLVDSGLEPRVRSAFAGMEGEPLVSKWRGWTQTIGGQQMLGHQESHIDVAEIDVSRWASIDGNLEWHGEDGSKAFLVEKASLQLIRFSHFPFVIVGLVADMNSKTLERFPTRDMQAVLNSMKSLLRSLPTLSTSIGGRSPSQMMVVHNKMAWDDVKALIPELTDLTKRIATSESYVEFPSAALRRLVGDDPVDEEDGARTAYAFQNEIVALVGSAEDRTSPSFTNVRVDVYGFRDPRIRNAHKPLSLASGRGPVGIFNATVGNWVIPAASAMWLDFLHTELNTAQNEIVALQESELGDPPQSWANDLSDLQGRLQELSRHALWVGENLGYWAREDAPKAIIRRTQTFPIPWSPTRHQHGEVPALIPFDKVARRSEVEHYERSLTRLDRHLTILTSRADFYRAAVSARLTDSMARGSTAVGWFTAAILALTVIQLVVLVVGNT